MYRIFPFSAGEKGGGASGYNSNHGNPGTHTQKKKYRLTMSFYLYNPRDQLTSFLELTAS